MTREEKEADLPCGVIDERWVKCSTSNVLVLMSPEVFFKHKGDDRLRPRRSAADILLGLLESRIKRVPDILVHDISVVS